MRRAYRITGLAPGKYELTVEKTGYKKSITQNLSVTAEVVQGNDVILEIGEITATVIVSDETAVSCKLKTQTSRKESRPPR